MRLRRIGSNRVKTGAQKRLRLLRRLIRNNYYARRLNSLSLVMNLLNYIIIAINLKCGCVKHRLIEVISVRSYGFIQILPV